MKRVRGVEKIGKIREMERIEGVRKVEKAIVEIR